MGLKQSEKEILECAMDAWNKTSDLLFIHSDAYNYLKKEGRICLSESQKEKIRGAASAMFYEISWKHKYRELSLSFLSDNKINEIISRIAKKIAVSEFFKESEMQLTIQKNN